MESFLPHCPWLMVHVIVRMDQVALKASIRLFAVINSSARCILIVQPLNAPTIILLE